MSPSTTPPLSTTARTYKFGTSATVTYDGSSNIRHFIQSKLDTRQGTTVIPTKDPTELTLPTTTHSGAIVVNFIPGANSPMTTGTGALTASRRSIVSSSSTPSVVSNTVGPNIPVAEPMHIA